MDMISDFNFMTTECAIVCKIENFTNSRERETFDGDYNEV